MRKEIAVLIVALAVCPAPLLAQTSTGPSLQRISNDDLAKLSTSGCSLDISRGKDLVAYWDTDGTPEKKGPQAIIFFKTGGKIVRVTGTIKRAAKTEILGAWTGTLSGYEIRILQGPRDPKMKNDGGGIGGNGRLEWKGPKGEGSFPVTWMHGC
jgi:hypothetical protein